MSLSVAIAVFWAIASTIVAFLPMRHQYIPGATLLFAAPLIIILIGYQHGWVWMLPCVLGFLSMYRNPLRYLWRKWRGLPTEVPE
jgi:hypothetical protein